MPNSFKKGKNQGEAPLILLVCIILKPSFLKNKHNIIDIGIFATSITFHIIFLKIDLLTFEVGQYIFKSGNLKISKSLYVNLLNPFLNAFNAIIETSSPCFFS